MTFKVVDTFRNGIGLTVKTVTQILTEQGFARLPRRTSGERAMYLSGAIEQAEPTDVRLFGSVGRAPTGYADLFFFVPLIAEPGIYEVFSSGCLYGSALIPKETYL